MSEAEEATSCSASGDGGHDAASSAERVSLAAESAWASGARRPASARSMLDRVAGTELCLVQIVSYVERYADLLAMRATCTALRDGLRSARGFGLEPAAQEANKPWARLLGVPQPALHKWRSCFPHAGVLCIRDADAAGESLLAVRGMQSLVSLRLLPEESRLGCDDDADEDEGDEDDESEHDGDRAGDEGRDGAKDVRSGGIDTGLSVGSASAPAPAAVAARDGIRESTSAGGPALSPAVVELLWGAQGLTSLTRLELSSPWPGVRHEAHLVRGLPLMSRLTDLALGDWCSLSEPLCAALGRMPALTTLRLRATADSAGRCGGCDSPVADEFGCSCTAGATAHAVAAVARSTSIKDLSLVGMAPPTQRACEVMFAALGGMVQLEHLDLSNMCARVPERTDVNGPRTTADFPWQHLAALTNLQSLDLFDAHVAAAIGEDLFRAVRGMDRLRRLDVGGTFLSNVFPVSAGTWPELQDLSLFSQTVPSDDVTAALAGRTSLTRLQLSFTRNAVDRSLMRRVAELSSLRELLLVNAGVDAARLDALSHALPALEVLQVGHPELDGSTLCRALEGKSRLRELSVQDSECLGHGFLARLAALDLPRLRALELVGCTHVVAGDLGELPSGSLPSLQCLDISAGDKASEQRSVHAAAVTGLGGRPFFERLSLWAPTLQHVPDRARDARDTAAEKVGGSGGAAGGAGSGTSSAGSSGDGGASSTATATETATCRVEGDPLGPAALAKLQLALGGGVIVELIRTDGAY